MLDETMTYSCAVFEHPDESLADAQRREVRAPLRQLELGPDDHVLEIGCGWGGFALLRRATSYGCRVTGLTISHEQAALARERTTRALPVEIRRAGLPDGRGELHEGRSIEMLEAIGENQFGTYFATIDRVLAPRRPRGRADDPRSRTSAGTATADPGLDRALRLPRLPDPVARRARARRRAAFAARRSTASTRSARTTPRRSAAGARTSTSASTRCARSATTAGSSARGTSISPSARPASARARCATRNSCSHAPDDA